MKKIAIASDHGGYLLKETIKSTFINDKSITLIDHGTHSEKSVDYPDYAQKVVNSIISNESSIGILCCGTGIGMAIKANRNPKIRAAVAYNETTAKLCKSHNNTNILCLGERTTSSKLAIKIITIWLQTEFEGNRHLKRIQKL